MNKDIIVFDWEVFPNWNCMVWGVYTPDLQAFTSNVITSDDPDYLQKLKSVAHSGYLTGFNIKAYDMQILNFACKGYTPQELYSHNQKIMANKSESWTDISYWRFYDFIDLRDDLKTMGSLKQFESNTGLAIRETTVPFGKANLTEQDKEDIIRYCKYDVYATNALCKARWGYLVSKANCSKLSPLPEAECVKNTAAKICAKMLGAKQRENFNPPYYQIPDKLDKIFRENIHSNIIDTFDGTELVNDFSYKVRYMKNDIVYGTGGIHSTFKDALLAKSDEQYVLVNADFENLYPSLLILFNYYASGVPEKGRQLFEYLLSTCRKLKGVLREMKKKGNFGDEYDELFAERDSTKLILNASTGAMRLKFSDLYDPQNIISLCMTGQLLTTCMGKLLHNLNALILQMNTDGILFRIERSKLQEAKDLLSNFAEISGIPLEVEEQYAVYQKDVNNYILLSSPEAKPKLKGRWAKKSGSDVPLTPLNAPIINEAVINYYCKGIPLSRTIRGCNEPLKFMMTTMKGPTYDGVVYASEKGEVSTMDVNRVYASTNNLKGTLHKVKFDDDGNIIKHDKIASIPEHCSCFNDEVPTVGRLDDLDYSWYEDTAAKNLVDMYVL